MTATVRDGSVWWRLRVRVQECGPQGVVFNAHYVAFADMTQFEFWHATAGGYDALLARGLDKVVVSAEARYFAPAIYDDVLDIEGFISRVGTTSFEFTTLIYRDAETLTEVKMRYVFTDVEARTKTIPPADIRELLTAYRKPAPA